MITGSLQIKNGKYYAVINLKDSNGKRKPKWISTGLDEKNNKRKAEKFLSDKIKEYEVKEGLVVSDVLFSDYVLDWLEEYRKEIDEITYQGYENVINAHIVPYFKEKNIKLDRITVDILQKYIDEKYKHGRVDGKGGLSPKTLRIHKVLLYMPLKKAVRDNLINKNPCEFVSLPKNQKHNFNFYTEKQLSELFEAIKNEPIFPLVFITSMYGLRRSEVLGLKWSSIDFENNTFTIQSTVVKVTKTVEKDRTKNETSHRSFPLTPDTRELFIKLKSVDEENKKLFGKQYYSSEYIFKWSDGTPYRTDYVSRKFKQLLKKNNLPIINFHDLRHSCASLLIAKGFTLKDIQEWLGHSDIQTTGNIYAHLETNRKNNIANSIADSLKF